MPEYGLPERSPIAFARGTRWSPCAARLSLSGERLCMFPRSICSPFRRHLPSFHIASLLRRYLSSRDANMSWSVEAISATTSDTEPSILVTFDEAKYLFNTGENLSRAWLQSPRGWRNTRAIFLTSTSSHRVSGMPGKQAMVSLRAVNMHLALQAC